MSSWRAAATTSRLGCELPLAPDSDGDGYRDDVDACPSQVDQGFGLDGTGCPLLPENGWHATCVADGGTYGNESVGDFFDYRCEWNGASPYANPDALQDAYLPICFDDLMGGSFSKVTGTNDRVKCTS